MASSSSNSSSSNSSSSSGLNVIALISGGKDSFFSALHCLENGHRLVALANLHPPPPPSHPPADVPRPGTPESSVGTASRASAACTSQEDARVATQHLDQDEQDDEVDLNSFMYQTVGHQVIPLYASATGLPLYRAPILGGPVQHARDYHPVAAAAAAEEEEAVQQQQQQQQQDETESMLTLLQTVLAAHPEANAVSAGAILSTYQRTRVESVALRLGLTPLAYLWKYPVLHADEAQLLRDMAGVGLDARIVKVASGGLDEGFLWANVAGGEAVIARLKRAMGRFGCERGAVLGEGGEFETLVVDGPRRLFRKRVVVQEEESLVVKEGGGTAWVKVRRAAVEPEPKPETETAEEVAVRRPELWDARFTAVLKAMNRPLEDGDGDGFVFKPTASSPSLGCSLLPPSTDIITWSFTHPNPSGSLTIRKETSALVAAIRAKLAAHNLPSTAIQSTLILLRNMSDFATINPLYATLFSHPNPPSRVTISCGAHLPNNIAITLHLAPALSRQGLHVQSRSYWAPANIGPYSQAITAGGHHVHIAGQIPLVPASMEFLPSGGDGQQQHIALGLQHLWRIGLDVGVGWWTSAVVYFKRSADDDDNTSREKARLAARAWTAAHHFKGGAEDEESGGGPDLFSRALFTADAPACLPDYSLLDLDDDDEDEEKPVPFFFAAEVEGLPRDAEAEWHAHAGVKGAAVRVYRLHETAGVEVEHCVLQIRDGDDDGWWMYSVVAFASAVEAKATLEQEIAEAERLVLSSSSSSSSSTATGARPYLLYVDSTEWSAEEIAVLMASGEMGLVPCRRMWNASPGWRLRTVALYRTRLVSSVP